MLVLSMETCDVGQRGTEQCREKTKEFVESTYMSALQVATQYNAKLLEFARINNEAVMSYFNELSG